jgi:competence protein ComEA
MRYPCIRSVHFALWRGAAKVGLSRVGLIVIALIAAVVAVYALFQAIDDRSAPPIIIEDGAATLPVVVDVRGAVVSPGVYELPADARWQDAVDAAGGLSPEADLSTINLARRLRDGDILVIGSLMPATDSQIPAEDGSSASSGSQTRININTASIDELEVLPGIGEVTAQRIVDFREQNGPYRSIDDLVHVQGISTRTIDGLRDLVAVGP